MYASSFTETIIHFLSSIIFNKDLVILSTPRLPEEYNFFLAITHLIGFLYVHVIL